MGLLTVWKGFAVYVPHFPEEEYLRDNVGALKNKLQATIHPVREQTGFKDYVAEVEWMEYFHIRNPDSRFRETEHRFLEIPLP